MSPDLREVEYDPVADFQPICAGVISSVLIVANPDVAHDALADLMALTASDAGASILLRLPGAPSNAITCIDGYPTTQQGLAGVALFVTTIASFFGGTVGILVLMLLTPLMVRLGPAKYITLILFVFRRGGGHRGRRTARRTSR